MVITPIVPMLEHIDESFASSGVMLTSEIRELEARLPRHVLNALEAINHQMENEIFSPILRASGINQLEKEFARVFQSFADLYISASFLLWSEIGDVPSFVSLCSPIVEKLKTEIERNGVKTIGEAAVNDMLVGLATVGLVNQKLLNLAQAGEADKAGDLKEIQGWSVAYWLSSSCVYRYHFDKQGDSQNVKVLAYWSRHYATGVYKCAKSLRVIQVPIGKGRIPKPSEEEKLLSEVGLEDFAEHLALEDTSES